MQERFERRYFHNAHEWRRFFLLWITILLWALFLVYMLLFHYQRVYFEPLVMSYFSVDFPQYFQFVEIKLFIYLLWSCCVISVLAIINTWNKKRRDGDNIPDIFLIVIMLITVSFALYYAKTDLNYLNGELSILSDLFGD